MMIRENENLVLSALQIVSSVLECFDDDQQLLIVYLIIALCRIHLERIVSN